MGTGARMSSEYDAALHALSVEPRVARPGDVVRLRFRTINHGDVPTPRTIVRFVLDAALEALGETHIEIVEVPPGGALLAETCARVAASADDGMRLGAQAVLRLPDVELGTNRCAVLVRGRAVLDGAASGTFVEPLDAETVRVRAVVCNEGDATARNVRIIVREPHGCARIGDDPRAGQQIERLAPGESAELAFLARIVEPVDEIAADDAEVCTFDGRCCALPVRSTVTPAPAIVPSLAVDVARSALGVSIELRNDGWIAARDVQVEIDVPAGVRYDDAAIRVDGVPARVATRRGRPRGKVRGGSSARAAGHDEPYARVERTGSGPAITVGRVRARGTARIEMTATYGADCDPGVVRARTADGAIDAPFAPVFVSDVRIEAVDVPRGCEPGHDAVVGVRVLNAGDRAEHLTISSAPAVPASSADASSATPAPERESTSSESVVLAALAPGNVAHARLVVRIPDDAADGETRSYRMIVRRDDGSSADVRTTEGAAEAQCVVALMVRDRPGVGIDVGPSGDTTRAELPPLDVAPPGRMTPALHLPASVVAGAPFTLGIDLVAEDAIEECVVSLSLPPGLSTVAGSSTVDAHAFLDRDGASPLVAGLALRDVPASTRLRLACSVLAAATIGGERRDVVISLATAGEPREVARASISIVARSPFASRPAGLPYHVDACALPSRTVDGHGTAEAPSSPPAGSPEHGTVDAREQGAVEKSRAENAHEAEDFTARLLVPEHGVFGELLTADSSGAFTFTLRLDDVRASLLDRLLRGANARFVDHLVVLRALFPDTETSGDPRVTTVLDETAAALADVFDRLFVKLRIPAFDVTGTDLEDETLRSSLLRLFERLRDAVPGAAASPALPCATVSGGAIRALAASLDADAVRRRGDAARARRAGADAVWRRCSARSRARGVRARVGRRACTLRRCAARRVRRSARPPRRRRSRRGACRARRRAARTPARVRRVLTMLLPAALALLGTALAAIAIFAPGPLRAPTVSFAPPAAPPLDPWPSQADAWSPQRDAWPAQRDAWPGSSDRWSAQADPWPPQPDAWSARRGTAVGADRCDVTGVDGRARSARRRLRRRHAPCAGRRARRRRCAVGLVGSPARAR